MEEIKKAIEMLNNFCDVILDMPCGCECCPLFDEDSLDDDGNMVCNLEKLRREDE